MTLILWMVQRSSMRFQSVHLLPWLLRDFRRSRSISEGVELWRNKTWFLKRPFLLLTVESLLLIVHSCLSLPCQELLNGETSENVNRHSVTPGLLTVSIVTNTKIKNIRGKIFHRKVDRFRGRIHYNLLTCYVHRSYVDEVELHVVRTFL